MPESLYPYFWLLVGGALYLFATGRWTVAAIAWVAPVFTLHFARHTDPAAGFLALGLVLWAATFWAYRGQIPVPGRLAAAIAAGLALPAFLAHGLDRLAGFPIETFVSTLAFPCGYAALDFAVGRLSPYGTWGSVANTQYRNLALLQLASATGTPGVTFMLTWFAAVANWAWDRDFDWVSTRAGVLIYAGAWVIVMLAGGIRVLSGPRAEKSVRAAAVGWPDHLGQRSWFLRALDRELPDDERESLRRSFQGVQEYFLDATRREARAGAKLFVWPEANAMMFADDEPAFLDRLRALARDEGIHVLAGVATVFSGSERPLENKAMLVGPTGRVEAVYVKAIPVPGFEARLSRKGPRSVMSVETDYGRLAAVICFDLDFPAYIRQVGSAAAEVVLVPASDWEAIKWGHHAGAVLRAVENGATMIRATRWGLSSVVDPCGRELALLDPFVAPSQVFVAQVPLRGMRTLYTRFGDWFGWLSVAGVLALTFPQLA